jgi:hypothetical protein
MREAPFSVYAGEMIVYHPAVPDPEPPAEPAPPAEPESDETDAYFHAIEEIFLRLRGAGTTLSPADWQLAARWHREGVPLALVERVMAEVFARRRARGKKGRIQSLRYCENAVDAAWAEIREMTGPGRRLVVEPLEVPPRLAALAAALPPGLPGRDELAAKITALGPPADGTGARGTFHDSEVVEDALARLDRDLLERAAAALSAEERAALESHLESTLATLADRLPAEELDAARDRLRRQLLRQHLRLPVLSLFSPEAEPRADF